MGSYPTLGSPFSCQCPFNMSASWRLLYWGSPLQTRNNQISLRSNLLYHIYRVSPPNHTSYIATAVSDFVSCNTPEYHEPKCQVCNFALRTGGSVVCPITVQDGVQDSAKLPFTSRNAWLLAQRECPDLRCTQAHFHQGSRPSKKVTDACGVKRYLQVPSIARNGLFVVRHEKHLSPVIILQR